MRVLSFPVRGWVEPGVVFTAVYGTDSHAVWLDSGVHAVSGLSVMGSASRVLTASVADGTVVVDGETRVETVFEFLQRELRDRIEVPAGVFALGWVGWLGYELRSQTMQVEPVRRSRYPDAALAFLDRAIAFDHATRTVSLIALGEVWDDELLDWRDELLGRLEAARSPTPVGGPGSTMPPLGNTTRRESPGVETSWAYTDDDYLAMIRDCQAAIAAGDAYQLCLTTEVRVAVHPDPLSAYLALRLSSPTHHGAFVRMGGVSLLSASPEQFLAVSPAGQVQTSPIKGTRRRGATPQEDARLRDELLDSDKERAENLMIVDLMRKFSGRIDDRCPQAQRDRDPRPAGTATARRLLGSPGVLRARRQHRPLHGHPQHRARCGWRDHRHRRRHHRPVGSRGGTG